MQTGLDFYTVRQAEKKKKRRLLLISLSAFLVIFGFSLCIRTAAVGLVAPQEVLLNLFTCLKLNICKLLSLPGYLEAEYAIMNDLPLYFETLARFKISLLSFTAGGMMAVAGAVYQGVFRNPIAAPTMLGVSSGINFAIIIMTYMFGSQLYSMTAARYQFAYIGAAVMLVIVMLASKLIAGKKRKAAVTDMLLMGIVLSQILGCIESYLRFEMDPELLRVLQELSSGIYINLDTISFVYLGASLLIGFLPIFLMRFSFNVVCFPDEDAYNLGINPKLLRYTLLIAATLLIASATVHVGAVGMLALIIPHFCRYFFGVDSRKLVFSSFVYGGLFLLVCRGVSASISFGMYGALPIATVVSVIAAPVFVIVLLQQRRGWE